MLETLDVVAVKEKTPIEEAPVEEVSIEEEVQP